MQVLTASNVLLNDYWTGCTRANTTGKLKILNELKFRVAFPALEDEDEVNNDSVAILEKQDILHSTEVHSFVTSDTFSNRCEFSTYSPPERCNIHCRGFLEFLSLTFWTKKNVWMMMMTTTTTFDDDDDRCHLC